MTGGAADGALGPSALAQSGHRARDFVTCSRLNDDAFEIIGASEGDAGRKLLIVRSMPGADRFLHLNANRGRLEYRTEGQTAGHSAARDAFSMAAVDARPIVGTFDGTESVETYSSDGPRRVFYEADGTPITPGVFDPTGGELRQKPDLTAADCVSTATPGFSTFCGTSAAAPHAAAITALLLDINGNATSAEIRAALEDTALDIEVAGVDRDSGVGIIDALAAGNALPQCLVDADCDDTLFCNGVETCDGNRKCQPGTVVDPDDGVVRTDDSCDEVADLVVNAPNDGSCDDGGPCTADSCDEVLGCGHDPILGCGGAAVPATSTTGRLLLLLFLAGSAALRLRRPRTSSGSRQDHRLPAQHRDAVCELRATHPDSR